jgi:hypothetical protein
MARRNSILIEHPRILLLQNVGLVTVLVYSAEGRFNLYTDFILLYWSGRVLISDVVANKIRALNHICLFLF